MHHLSSSQLHLCLLPACWWSVLHRLPLISCWMASAHICTACLLSPTMALPCWYWAKGCHMTFLGYITWRCIYLICWTFDQWETDACGQIFHLFCPPRWTILKPVHMTSWKTVSGDQEISCRWREDSSYYWFSFPHCLTPFSLALAP